jgi:hypothetical protein
MPTARVAATASLMAHPIPYDVDAVTLHFVAQIKTFSHDTQSISYFDGIEVET